MFIVNNHIVNLNSILVMGEYALGGRLCTRIMEGDKYFLVSRPPEKVLDGTLNYIGYDLRGATKGARELLGIKSMCPIILNPVQGVCLFPLYSPEKDINVWLNPVHIERTTAYNGGTKVKFSNGVSIEVDLKLSTFNNKTQIADQLRRMTNNNGKRQMSLYVEKKPEHLITKEKTGRYNFDILTKKKKD